MKQITQFFLEGESPTLKYNRTGDISEIGFRQHTLYVSIEVWV